ncbi:DUF2878 domain-containing protein [Shewanella electrodiphila]|uniref:DUF2878 domain-containing protein n=1 Tax=Shewanella electrodiphila TaxID=934143 RepID=A0ABT0KJD5_9GAMM|nr:DUF2878 domain-containing protein [Shewanella electrodiphila]MCL1043953.1 DUF2878 domain-containing protein [Shewanella electrodiphila]
MPHSAHTNIINALAFQVIWWAGVLAANQLIIIPIILIIWHFVASQQKSFDFKVLMVCASVGILLDTVLVGIGLFEFQVFPLWLGLLWGYFALSLNYSLALFNHFPISIQALLGGIFGSLSYIGGANLNAVDLPYGTVTSGLALMLIWSLMFPLFLWLSKVIGLKHARTDFEKLV